MANLAGQSETVRLRIICQAAPMGLYNGTDTEFGLQDRQQHLIPGERHADGSLRYEFAVQLRGDDAEAALRFACPYVHGTAAAPFLYLGWREVGAERSSWIKRLKIPMAPLFQVRPRMGFVARGGVWEATVDGDGSGTVPLLGDGWTWQQTHDD